MRPLPREGDTLFGSSPADHGRSCGTGFFGQKLSAAGDDPAEQARLHKEIEKLNAEISKVSAQLANERFVANAPEAVVGKEKERLAQARTSLQQLQEQLEKLNKL